MLTRLREWSARYPAVGTAIGLGAALRVTLWVAVPGKGLSPMELGALTTASVVTAVLSVLLLGSEG